MQPCAKLSSTCKTLLPPDSIFMHIAHAVSVFVCAIVLVHSCGEFNATVQHWILCVTSNGNCTQSHHDIQRTHKKGDENDKLTLGSDVVWQQLSVRAFHKIGAHFPIGHCPPVKMRNLDILYTTRAHTHTHSCEQNRAANHCNMHIGNEMHSESIFHR